MLEEVASGVWVAHAELYATTSTVVVGPGGGALVVDPGVTASEIDRLAGEIRDHGWRVVGGFSTHPHWDHLLWSSALGPGPRWATSEAVAAVTRTRARLTAEALADLGSWDADGAGCFASVTPLPPDSPIPGWPGRALVIGHDAHAPGHAALLLPDRRVLLAGDMLSDVECPLLDLDGRRPVEDYRDGLDRLAAVVDDGLVDVLVPGHGTVADAAEAQRRIALDRTYLADVAVGLPSADPRLDAAPAWLRTAHEEQARLLRAGGRPR